MKITMVGAGYVGLVSGVCFSDFGHEVVCVDKIPERVASLAAGEVPIYEPGLSELLRKNVEAGRLSFWSDAASAVKDADAIFIAVGTPSRRGDGTADLSFVFQAAREIAPALQDGAVVVLKSTVPVGTNRVVKGIIEKARPELDFSVASNPEFLREGSAIEDFMRPDRVVVGVEDDRAATVLREIYAPLYLRDFPVVMTSLESAELIKYASNAFLATKIGFINEMARLCEATGGDVREIARGMGMDRRIGDKFLRAGPGYGGSCFPKDTKALVQMGSEVGARMTIVDAVIRSNSTQKGTMVSKVMDLCERDLRGRRIAILGVTFKPETDDMRDAPALTIIPALQAAGARVVAVDPQGRKEADSLLDDVEWMDDPYAATNGADAVVILTEWNQFRALDLDRMAGLMRRPRMADLRNVYSADQALSAGFQAYTSVGRPAR